MSELADKITDLVLAEGRDLIESTSYYERGETVIVHIDWRIPAEDARDALKVLQCVDEYVNPRPSVKIRMKDGRTAYIENGYVGYMDDKGVVCVCKGDADLVKVIDGKLKIVSKTTSLAFPIGQVDKVVSDLILFTDILPSE